MSRDPLIFIAGAALSIVGPFTNWAIAILVTKANKIVRVKNNEIEVLTKNNQKLDKIVSSFAEGK